MEGKCPPHTYIKRVVQADFADKDKKTKKTIAVKTNIYVVCCCLNVF